MSTVLVTGGAGFIGSHIVDTLITHGFRVIVVDDLSSGKEGNINPKATFYRLDIRNTEIRDIFAEEKIDWVSHHAAQINVLNSIADPQQDAQVNICGLLNLLGNCLHYKVKGVVLASSGGTVYGEPNELPVTETCPKGPLSPYGVSKLSSEYYGYYFHRVHGLPYVAMRYGNVYGSRQDSSREAGVAAIFAGKMLTGKIPTIFGDGMQLRDYIFVEDVATANLQAMKRLVDIPSPKSIDDNAYNIGAGVGTSVNELFACLKEITGFRNNARHGAERKGEMRQIILDVSKAGKELSWKPAVGLSDGLGKLVGYLRGAGN